jgi:two-component system NtrC family response regulator
MTMNTILIVDDEKNMLISLKAILQDENYAVTACGSGEEGLKALESRKFDVLITDLKMNGMTGLELMEVAQQKYPAMPVILMTAYATPKSAVEAIKAGAFDYIPKPFDPEEIIFSIRKATEFIAIQNENIQLKESLHIQKALDDIIGDDPSMTAVRELIKSVAPTKATILLEGESGTGKELAAKAIHDLSERRGKKFVAVNCAAIPETLLESELFGHEKGSFTGAIGTKKGKFEVAEDGTLYLDEIGDMSLPLQAKILRVLEDGHFERVGSTEPLYSKARIIAATNKDLKKAIHENNFREDLYFRLNVINVLLPPLREKVGDIPILINSFIRRFNIAYNKNIRGISPQALKLMSHYSWPGNIRELKNIIERSILLAKTDLIEADTLPAEMLRKQEIPGVGVEFHGTIDFKTSVENYEKQMIQWALEKNQYRIGSSAKALGLSRHSLRHYLLKYFQDDARKLNAD